MSTTQTSSISRNGCRIEDCPHEVFSKRHQLCKRHRDAFAKNKQRTGVFGPAERQPWRPQDDYLTAVRKTLAGKGNWYSASKASRAQNFGYVQSIGPDRTLNDVAHKSRFGKLGNASPSNTAMHLHKCKPEKKQSEPPRPILTQGYKGATKIIQAPLPNHSQSCVPGWPTSEPGVVYRKAKQPTCKLDWGPCSSRPITFSANPVPTWKPSKMDALARYNGTRRLHVLGWFPPSCEREDDESAVVLAELVPDSEDN